MVVGNTACNNSWNVAVFSSVHTHLLFSSVYLSAATIASLQDWKAEAGVMSNQVISKCHPLFVAPVSIALICIYFISIQQLFLLRQAKKTLM